MRIVVFIEGDFWHGYRYSRWAAALSPFWRAKIQLNRRRDQRNFAALRRLGWRVIRIWQHEIESDLDRCVHKVLKHLL